MGGPVSRPLVDCGRAFLDVQYQDQVRLITGTDLQYIAALRCHVGRNDFEYHFHRVGRLFRDWRFRFGLDDRNQPFLETVFRFQMLDGLCGSGRFQDCIG